jgi:radical SAM superfamily enzyme YgiQ (UPF0313 family)
MTWRAIREARKRLERETGTIQKDWGGRLPIALIRPTSYYLGMSSLGFQTVYGLLNDYDDVVCERVLWEPKRPEAEDAISIESQRPIADFDVLAFSISYELAYINAVRLLEASRIPLLAADRDERHPLLIAGGPCVTANPMPLSPYFDCLAIGEAEPIMPPLMGLLREGLESRRHDLLRELSLVPGLYVPLLHDGTPVKRQWMRDLDSATTTSIITTPDTELSNMYLIEIARGCPWGCRFCLAGYCFRPFRHRSMENLLAQASEGLNQTKRIGLLAAAVSDHPQIEELVRGLRGMGAELSVSSLRIRPLPGPVLAELARSGSQSISLAPEAGSERLRQVINKGISEDDIIEAVAEAAGVGFRQVKLYFMIGLPTETDDDAEEIISLSLELKSRVDGTGCRLALTVAPFVPKANTPFQRLGMAESATLERRLRRIKRALARSGIEIRAESVAWSTAQAALSRGDARLGAALAGISGGALSDWRSALQEHDLRTEDYAHRVFSEGETLPWSVADTGVRREYMEAELKMAQAGEASEPCPPGDCTVCGVCE